MFCLTAPCFFILKQALCSRANFIKMIHGHLTHLLVSSNKILNGNCMEAAFLIFRNASHLSGRRCLETTTTTVRSTHKSVFRLFLTKHENIVYIASCSRATVRQSLQSVFFYETITAIS